MKRSLPFFAFLFLLLSSRIDAQTFTDLQNGFPTLGSASTAWADYDNDNDPDFAVIGFSGLTSETSSIYRNDSGGVFTLVASLTPAVSMGAVSWGDYDHDGDVDLLINGQGGNGSPAAVTTLYRNDSNSVFTAVATSLPGVIGVTRWIDYDGDGWLDVILSGYGVSLTGDSTWLYHNDTNGIFTQIPTSLPGYVASDVSIVDFDDDGDNDFFLVGGTISSTTDPISRLYRNDGNGIFNLVPYNFINLSTGTSVWADNDNDGDKDLLYDGLDSTFGNGVTLLYQNDSAGNFTLINANLPGSGEPGSVDWADIDNDGDLDILLGDPQTVLRNDGNNIYTDITPPAFPASVPCSFSDIDNDGDPDILLIAQSGGFTASTIFRNDNTTAISEMKPDEDFQIYPNPATTVIKIHVNKELKGNVELSFSNILGEEITFQKLKQGAFEITVDVSALKPGLYFYSLKESGVVIKTGKVVKE